MRKLFIACSLAVSMLMLGTTVFSQDEEHRRRQPPRGEGGEKARPRPRGEGGEGERSKPRDGERERAKPREREREREGAEPERERRERERANPSRREREQPPRNYAVPRNRPLPRPHPEYGPYNRGHYRGRHFLWRPYPRAWRYPNICVPGYWEWDYWYGGWVWIEGFCNNPRYRIRPGFYFWFEIY